MLYAAQYLFGRLRFTMFLFENGTPFVREEDINEKCCCLFFQHKYFFTCNLINKTYNKINLIKKRYIFISELYKKLKHLNRLPLYVTKYNIFCEYH